MESNRSSLEEGRHRTLSVVSGTAVRDILEDHPDWWLTWSAIPRNCASKRQSVVDNVLNELYRRKAPVSKSLLVVYGRVGSLYRSIF